jgi:hypothetical protein
LTLDIRNPALFIHISPNNGRKYPEMNFSGSKALGALGFKRPELRLGRDIGGLNTARPLRDLKQDGGYSTVPTKLPLSARAAPTVYYSFPMWIIL